MTLTTSTDFASVIAEGADWREVSKRALEDLQKARTEEDGMNFGFLYLTDALAEDAGSILTLFKSVTGIDHWIGCTGIGVAGCGREYVDTPAISAMIGKFDLDQVKMFHARHEGLKGLDKEVMPWMKTYQPMLVLTHGQPDADNLPVFTVEQINDLFSGFTAGGMTSSRVRHLHFGQDIYDQGFSGAAFSADIPVAAALSQGGRPVGPVYEISKASNNVIIELQDTQRNETLPAEDGFHRAVKELVREKTGQDADSVFLKQKESGGLDIPDEYQELFSGNMHIGFPVPGSDQKDFLMRNILGIDSEEGVLAVSETPEEGKRIHFIHRDDETVRADLSHALVQLRERVQKEQGGFNPKGAIYISCVARAATSFKEDTDEPGGEMALIKEIIGDIPLAGFYGGGEISGGRIYGYTGVLILFL